MILIYNVFSLKKSGTSTDCITTIVREALQVAMILIV